MKNLKLIGLLCLALILSACAAKMETCVDGGCGKVIPGTDVVLIAISVDANGNPVATPDTAQLKAGDRVVWVGPEGFQIDFPGSTPFLGNQFTAVSSVVNEVTLTHSAMKQNPDKIKPENVPESGTLKNYKYDVIVNTIRLDPILVIEY